MASARSPGTSAPSARTSCPARYDDLDAADLIVLVGSNTAWCHPVIWQRIVGGARERAARSVVVIDPRRTETCEDADLHLPLRPGTDVALFNGLLAPSAARAARSTRTFSTRIRRRRPDGCCDAARTRRRDLRPWPRACGLAAGRRARASIELFAAHRAHGHAVQPGRQPVDPAAPTRSMRSSTAISPPGRIGKPGAGPFSLTGQPNAMGGREVGGLANQLAAHMDFDARARRPRCGASGTRRASPTKPGLKAVDMFDAVARRADQGDLDHGDQPGGQHARRRARCARRWRRARSWSSPTASPTPTRRAIAHVRLPAPAWGEKDGTVTNSERRISRQRALPAAARRGQARLVDRERGGAADGLGRRVRL